MSFRIYKGNEVIVEGESPLSITGIAPNTDVIEGTYQVVRVDGNSESKRVDIPAFKTLPIEVESVDLTPKNMTGESGIASSRQLNVTVLPENSTNQEVVYSISPESESIYINEDGILEWSEDAPVGEYTITVKTVDGDKKAESSLVLSEPEILEE